MSESSVLPARSPALVLLVEDNPADIALLSALLEEQPCEFTLETVASFGAAAERLKREGIDLIVTDLRLPDSDEEETVPALRALARDVPLIVLSGLHTESIALRTVGHGAQDYLVKGRFDHATLLRTLRYAVERHDFQRELQRAHDDLEERVRARTAELAETAARLEEAVGQLQHAQQRLIQQERLRALGQMASGIAHDFNNTLAPIVGYSDLLLHSRGLNEAQRSEYLKIIHTAASDSSNVVSRLREFFRYRDEHDVFGPVNLNDLAAQSAALTRPRWRDQALGRGVEIQFETDFRRIPAVLGSESELREMLVNLILNASDAITERQGRIVCRTFEHNGSATLQIIDNGCGMPEEVRLRCFEPFFSTKADHGSGLGLSMVYGTVRRHEGTIDIQSAPGAGTCVTITLVAYEEARPTEPSRMPAKAAPLRILVVDDEAPVREVLKACLEEDGHYVGTASEGEEALERFREGAPWDMVLTDRAMPRMNGDELALHLRQMEPNLPILLVTGFADLMQDVGDQPGAIDLVVRKPFTIGSLREGISRALSMRNAKGIDAPIGDGASALAPEME